MSCSPASSGGATPALPIALIGLSANATVNNAAALPFDTVVSDSLGLWVQASNKFTIPSGQGGVYLFSPTLDIADTIGTATGISLRLRTSGSFNDLTATFPRTVIGGTQYGGASALVGQYGAGEDLTTAFFVTGAASARVNINSVMALIKIA